MICILEQEVQFLLSELKSKNSNSPSEFSKYQNLLFVAVCLRRFDIESNIVSLSFLFSGEKSELYLRIQCLLSNCALKVVIDSKGNVMNGAFEWDDTFVCRTVKLHKRLSLSCWQDKNKFVCDSVFDIWKQLISEGVLRMDL